MATDLQCELNLLHHLFQHIPPTAPTPTENPVLPFGKDFVLDEEKVEDTGSEASALVATLKITFKDHKRTKNHMADGMVEYLKQIELPECNREALVALVDILEKYTTEDDEWLKLWVKNLKAAAFKVYQDAKQVCQVQSTRLSKE